MAPFIGEGKFDLRMRGRRRRRANVQRSRLEDVARHDVGAELAFSRRQTETVVSSSCLRRDRGCYPAGPPPTMTTSYSMYSSSSPNRSMGAM